MLLVTYFLCQFYIHVLQSEEQQHLVTKNSILITQKRDNFIVTMMESVGVASIEGKAN